jgi:WD40 repeat protein
MKYKYILAIVLLWMFIPSNVQAAQTTVKLSWHPHLDIIAVTDSEGDVTLIDAVLGDVLNEFAGTITGNPTNYDKAAWSWDGRYLALIRDFDVEIWERPWSRTDAKLVSTYQYYQQPSLSEPDVYPRALTWHPNNEWIATVIGGYIDVWSIDQNVLLYRFTGYQVGTLDLQWNDEGVFASGGSLGLGIIWDIETGEPHHYYNTFIRGRVQSAVITTLDWHPDGNLLALGTEDNSIRIWNTQSGDGSSYADDTSSLTTRPFYPNQLPPILSIKWSPDGKYIASSDEDGNLRIYEADTRELVQSVEIALGSQIHSVSWSPFGGRLAFSAKTGIVPKGVSSIRVATLASGDVRVFVPLPSLERLNTLIKQCTKIKTEITQTHQLPYLLTELEKVTETSASCKEDIRAMAAELQ